MDREELKKFKESFDLQEYLQEIDINYSTEGDNVSEGWINVQCPFCSDHANHLGINEESKNIHCWMCGVTGDVLTFIQELEEVSFSVAVNRLREFQSKDIVGIRKNERRRKYGSILPENFERIIPGREPELVKRYMERRRFPLSICQEHGLGWVRTGEYQLRLIVPVFLSGELMSFQAIDMTGDAKVPKLDCPEGRARVINKELLYGIDDVGGQVILVEGIADKWRLGRAGVGMFGKVLHPIQRTLLYQRARGKRIKVLVDRDATRWEAERIGRELGALFSDVVVLGLEEGDPDDPADFDDDLVRKIVEM